MSYFPGVFFTQYHKSKAGYFINHDLLMHATPATRAKLIFYYIAEHTPQKLNPQDEAAYDQERSSRLTNSISFWTYATFLGLLLPASAWVIRTRRATAVRDLTLFAALSGYSATVVNSTLWRTQEARMVESSEVVSRLATKYNFGIFDFALAKKQTHVQKLLEVYDAHRQNIAES